MKEIEDKQSSPIFSIKDLLKGKSPEELAEIAQMAAIQCRQLVGGKHSPASSEGSSTANFLMLLSHLPRNGIRTLKTHMMGMKIMI
jgi:hypothetical protein